MAESTTFTIEQGATFAATYQPTVPLDLDGYTGKCQIRAAASADSPILASPTVTFGAGPTSSITLELTAAETAALPVSGDSSTDYVDLVFDVQAIDDPEVLRVLQGTVRVLPAVTR